MWKRLTLMAICLAVVAGCSRKREEADRLEEDVRAQDQGLAISPEDTLATPGSVDTTAAVAAAPILPPTKQPAAYSQSAPAGFVVQVAACPSYEYAEHLVDLYTQRGYQPYLTTTVHEGETYHRVRIGGFTSYAEAKAVMEEIGDKFSVDAWIDRSY